MCCALGIIGREKGHIATFVSATGDYDARSFDDCVVVPYYVFLLLVLWFPLQNPSVAGDEASRKMGL